MEWPTSVVVDPLNDNRIFLLDNGVSVLELSLGGASLATYVIGRPSHCSTLIGQESDARQPTLLKGVRNLAMTSHGDVILSSTGSDGQQQILRVDTNTWRYDVIVGKSRNVITDSRHKR